MVRNLSLLLKMIVVVEVVVPEALFDPGDVVDGIVDDDERMSDL